jgi:hypothetical protein
MNVTLLLRMVLRRRRHDVLSVGVVATDPNAGKSRENAWRIEEQEDQSQSRARCPGNLEIDRAVAKSKVNEHST